ncbi:ATP-grasp domain-containing protein [Kitasatospora sp. NPDC059571]|uniref:carboxylate--amine ligase n=1 Tax=Kitasatospora sp. NPDC059571 TaxID=3346871 RepID=UPI0036A3A68C
MPSPRIDRDVPAVLVRVGRYPHQQGVVGVIRTLGRLGVPVHAMLENRRTPAAVSRYLVGRHVRPTTGREDPEVLVAALLAIGRSVGRPSVAIATDDEAAVLLAEHADRLAEHFLLPPVAPGLPRTLASKDGLYRICRDHGVPTPRAGAPDGVEDLVRTARAWGYPVVLKNLEPWTRLRSPVVGHTTVVRDEAELLAACPPDGAPSVLLQEYLPSEAAEDWIAHLCCAPGGEPLVVFTGRKLRSWPPDAGVTARARALPNPELAELATGLCRRIGYCGVADMDWRYDRRDGRYKLVDFNPRVGAQFRAFETAGGVDVIRALHLSLTGRPVPRGPQLVRSFSTGQYDVPSALVWAWQQRRLPPGLVPARSTERGWLCWDDPAPAVAEAGWFTASVAQRLGRAVRR